ncbi:MAG: ABC transporter permease subunit [Pseudomonadota bacterium]
MSISDGIVVKVGRLAVVLLVLLVWELLSGWNELVPGIGDTVRALFTDVLPAPRFLANLWSTMWVVIAGTLIAGVTGSLTAVALGASQFLNAAYGPVLNALFSIPRILLYPVFLAALGITDSAKLWTAVLTGYFPIAINGIASVRSLDPILGKLGRSLCCSPWQMARHVYFPAAAPALLVAAKIAWSGTFLTVIGAEMFAARAGLGMILMNAYTVRRYPDMFAAAALIVTIALAGNMLLGRLERRYALS